MKKLIVLIILIALLLGFSRYKYISIKSKNITYVIEKYTTTGFFNKHKLSSLESYYEAFSDNDIAIIYVTGISSETIQEEVEYKLVLEKNKKGVWKVISFYPHT